MDYPVNYKVPIRKQELKFVRANLRGKGQKKIWREFVFWCEDRGLVPLPAHPWTVAAYLRWHEAKNPDMTAPLIKTIARVHLLANRTSPHRHPMVLRTLKMIEKQRHSRINWGSLFQERDFLAQPDESEKDETLPSDVPPSSAMEHGKKHRFKRSLRATPKLVTRRPSGRKKEE
jgi:hypothetical protein